MVLHCLKHFHIHHSINLSQKSYEMSMERTIFLLSREGKWSSGPSNDYPKSIVRWAKIPALTQNPGTPGKAAFHLKAHSHSSDGKHQRHNTCEMLKTQIFILPYLGLSLKGCCGRILSLFGWTESSGVLIIFCFKFVPWTCITYSENKVFVFPN